MYLFGVQFRDHRSKNHGACRWHAKEQTSLPPEDKPPPFSMRHAVGRVEFMLGGCHTYRYIYIYNIYVYIYMCVCMYVHMYDPGSVPAPPPTPPPPSHVSKVSTVTGIGPLGTKLTDFQNVRNPDRRCDPRSFSKTLIKP